MAGTLYEIPAQTWVDLPYSDGSIFHKSGGKVIYVESSDEPSGDYEDLPLLDSTTQNEKFPFHSVPDGESIWAYAPNVDAVISVTPVGE